MKTENLWELIGMLIGFSVSLILLAQIISEIRNPEPSSLSNIYLFGMIAVMGFWTAYGIKKRCLAVWTTNLLAGIFQVILLVIVMMGY